MKVLSVRAVVDSYQDKNGEKKQIWNEIGKCFVDDDGKISLKINCVPTNWNGYAVCVEPKPKDNTPF